MKNLLITILLVLVCCLFAVAAQAEDIDRSTVGVKIDAPNLVMLSPEWSIGTEIGKDMYTDVFRSSRHTLEDDKGYFGYIKLTYKGSILNLGAK